MKHRLDGLLLALLLVISPVFSLLFANDQKSPGSSSSRLSVRNPEVARDRGQSAPQGSNYAQATLTAGEIINRHLAAIGGREALARIKSRLMFGTVQRDNDPPAVVAIVSEPHKVSSLYRFKDYNWRFIFDGATAESRPAFPGQQSVVSEKYRQMIASGLMYNDISMYSLLNEGEVAGTRFETKGIKKLHDRSAYVLDFKRGRGDPMRLYFDAETFMWVRTDFGKVTIRKSQALLGGAAPIGSGARGITTGPVANPANIHTDDERVIDFYIETSDFRDVDGIKLPFKFEQIVTYPILRKDVGILSGTVSEYRHNVNVDPKSYQ